MATQTKSKVTANPDGLARRGFAFNADDMAQLHKLHAYIQTEIGSVSLAAALRIAIREAVAKRAKKYGE